MASSNIAAENSSGMTVAQRVGALILAAASLPALAGCGPRDSANSVDSMLGTGTAVVAVENPQPWTAKNLEQQDLVESVYRADQAVAALRANAWPNATITASAKQDILERLGDAEVKLRNAANDPTAGAMRERFEDAYKATVTVKRMFADGDLHHFRYRSRGEAASTMAPVHTLAAEYSLVLTGLCR